LLVHITQALRKDVDVELAKRLTGGKEERGVGARMVESVGGVGCGGGGVGGLGLSAFQNA
jgi:hypothetical protein